jgi:hypothetical protein
MVWEMSKHSTAGRIGQAEGIAQGLEALLAAAGLLLAHQQRQAGVVLGHAHPGPLVLVAGAEHHLAFDDLFEGLRPAPGRD